MHSTPLQPAGTGAPAAAYALGMHTPIGSRWVHTAGIVATGADGTTPSALADQAAAIWTAIAAILAAADMTFTDIVSYTAYVVTGEDLSVVMAARDTALRGHLAASTLVPVPALARPEWRMEIAVIAAAPADRATG
jgi:enamine deaminase RidA (YjgF/YER057c/UK114 family)